MSLRNDLPESCGNYISNSVKYLVSCRLCSKLYVLARTQSLASSAYIAIMVSTMRVFRRVFGITFSAILLISAWYAVFHAQDIRDWWILRGYVPSAEVANIASSTTMTDYGKHLFYVYDPQIETSTSFNQHCTIAEASIVLGCYNGVGIYVYDVTDPRLNGVHEVTAAHEMLHAGYDRLSDSERKSVDAMTSAVFANLQDERIKSVIESYRSRDPSVVPNELHSILGTEVRNLSPELEKYYQKYFTDRLAVVGYSEGYEQVFVDYKNKVAAYDVQLSELKSNIFSMETDLKSRASDLTSEKAQLDALYRAKNYEAYNSMVPGYNSAVSSYNSDLATYKSLIEQYNQIVEKRNALTVDQNSLVQALDSHASSL